MDEFLNNFDNIDATNIPPWAQMLITGMKLMITELKCVKDLARRINELESYKTVNEVVTQNLQNENKKLNDTLNTLELSIDDQEQRNRNYCLLLHGIEEQDGENTDDIVVNIINSELHLNEFSINNILRSHRLGPRPTARSTRNNPTKTRPIIFRLSDFRVRKSVFSNKKQLKGKGFSISENLTGRRYRLLKLATEKYGRGNVWTNEGRVTTKFDNKFYVINSESDLQ